VSQALEMGRPTVLALNMGDVARERGIMIDAAALSQRLGLPVVEIQANRKRGLAELKHELLLAVEQKFQPPESPFPEAFRDEVQRLSEHINSTSSPSADGPAETPRYLVERLLLDTGGYLEHSPWVTRSPGLLGEVKSARERLTVAGAPVPAVEAMSRYGWVSQVLDGVVTSSGERRVTLSDRIDRVLTHRLWGSVVFCLLMVVIFQAIFSGATGAMDAIEWIVEQCGEWVGARMAEGTLRSLIVEGVIGGVGGVIVFLPQILILFFFIAVLEDCGYMARAAYLMDRLMSRVGLSGKSFIPLLSSFACAIPGIMSTRVIENRRDRLVTILIAPLMSCSARLPVYTLLIGAFIPARSVLGGWLGLQGLTMFGAYFVGIFAAIVVALVLKKTVLKGETPPFVMELPSYKFPSPRTVLLRIVDRGWAFVRRAGTLILAVSVLVWAAAYFPRDPNIEQQVRDKYAAEVESLESSLAQFPEEERTAVEVDEATGEATPLTEAARRQLEFDALAASIDREVAGENLRHSYLGQAGRWIEPVVRPLGWDWRIGCAVIASFPAREVVIGAMGVIYNLGDEQDEESEPLRERLREVTWDGTDRPVYNVPVALSILVFFALCAQCAATLVIIRRETNSWRWPTFTFFYMTGLAYVAALLTYQIGMAIVS
ncbi:MAG: ferrous iron transport protein B, partial [Planctomycetales bacterium]|nr:ferrous iron transport protein B [Planctomycetales bacterium]